MLSIVLLSLRLIVLFPFIHPSMCSLLMLLIISTEALCCTVHFFFLLSLARSRSFSAWLKNDPIPRPISFHCSSIPKVVVFFFFFFFFFFFSLLSPHSHLTYCCVLFLRHTNKTEKKKRLSKESINFQSPPLLHLLRKEEKT